MRMIHVLEGDGAHSAHEETDVRRKLKDGQLSPEMFYWKDGMSEWRQL